MAKKEKRKLMIIIIKTKHGNTLQYECSTMSIVNNKLKTNILNSQGASESVKNYLTGQNPNQVVINGKDILQLLIQ